MGRYELLLFLHVATAIIWLGAAMVVQFFAFRAERADDAMEMHRVATDAEWLALRLFIPSSFAVLVFGVLLVLDGPWSFDQLWISLGLAGYAFSFLLGILFLSPESGRIGRLIEAHGPTHGSVTARISRILAVSRFELAVLFAVVLDMTVKPAADDAWFYVLAAAILVAGAALALRSYRRPGGGPAADLA
ncbi:MAG TPA: DUF2269 family protein [Gaiellaceae bacterium]|nr:DUF2269 family protein [Gaiellaceae bacterium]